MKIKISEDEYWPLLKITDGERGYTITATRKQVERWNIAMKLFDKAQSEIRKKMDTQPQDFTP